MPFVKPEWKSISTAGTLQEYISNPTGEIEYGGETITQLDYIKNYLFDGKYSNLITVENHGGITGDNQAVDIWGLHIDKENNDRMAFYCVRYPGGAAQYAELGFNAFRVITDYKHDFESGYNRALELVRRFELSQSGMTMDVKSYNTFCIIRLTGSNQKYTTTTTCVTLLYDFTNKEILIFGSDLEFIQFSKPDHYIYSQALTYDGPIGADWNPSTRLSSSSEIRYAKVKFIDGTEAKRVYMLTKFPPLGADRMEANTILHTSNKNLLVLPYWTDSYYAFAIDVTADMQ